jgi:hypothetical protein
MSCFSKIFFELQRQTPLSLSVSHLTSQFSYLRFFTFFILHFSFFISKGQVNLVPNPSFESYSSCPSNTGEVFKATGWDSYNGSPDYFNSCSSISQVDIPHNALGYQLAFNGNGYCGFSTYDNASLYREIIGVQLSSPLIVSQKYFVSFNVSRADSNYIVGYSSNKVGVKFSTVKSTSVVINNSAHYYTNSVITDTLNWIKIFGSFIADSAYLHLMIGNFFDDANTTFLNDANGQVAYYYIDDVCLSTDSIFTKNYATGTEETLPISKMNIFPNPANTRIFINHHSDLPKISVYNIIGEKVNYSFVKENEYIVIDCLQWPTGVYFFRSENQTYRVIINH